MNISVFGLGYVGVVGMGCLAELGHKVVGVDVNQNKVDLINQGKSPIIENQIGELIDHHFRAGHISATQNGMRAVIESDVSFICVGTPSTPQGHLNLESAFRVARNIAEGIKHKNGFHVVAIRSTVLPGSNEKLSAIISDVSGKVSNRDFAVVSNPEFLREGTAIKDYHHPPYTLLGSTCDAAIEIMKKVYEGIDAPIIAVEIGVAEMIKYINNAFHALKITFANEVGNICKRMDVDSHKLMRIFCMDTSLNISPYYLKPGFAYGGSCLPKDLKALCTMAHDLYLKCPVIESIDVSNEQQKELVLSQLLAFGKRKIGFLGLSFKAGTDDLRNSPIVDVLEKLLGKGFDIKIFDQNVNLSTLIGANKQFILERIPFISRFITDNIDEVVEHSEVVVIVNNEDYFGKTLRDVKRDIIIYDLINIGFDTTNPSSSYNGIAW